MSLRPINFIDGTDDELLQHLDSKSNKSQYVKDLIKKDMGMPTFEQMLVDRITEKIEKLLQVRIQESNGPLVHNESEVERDLNDLDLENIKSMIEEVGVV